MKNLIVASLVLVATSAFAGECVMKIKRDACPGKEAAAFKPYNGKTETEEKKTVGDEAACKAEAKKAAKIVRKGTLTKKTVAATFDGKDAGTESDSAECK
jgi:hypothetical protein